MINTKLLLLTIIALTIVSISISNAGSGKNEWVAPSFTANIVNPVKGNATAIVEGKKLFIQICAPCHGEKGKGDGIAGAALNPKPRNFTLDNVQTQPDGALYWKLSEGKPPMASYKDVLTETQRWQLVNYIRTFKK